MPELVENTRAYVQALYRTYGVPVLPDPEASAVKISRNIEQTLHNTQSLVITENRRDLETLTATAIDSAVTGFTRAGLAFQQGNNAAGGVEIARSLSSVFTTVANFSRFGKAAGPAGIVLTIIGEALSLVAFFLDTFVVTKAESRESALFDHIEKMIRGIYAENIEDHLNATIEALQTGGDGLAKTAAKYPGSVENMGPCREHVSDTPHRI